MDQIRQPGHGGHQSAPAASGPGVDIQVLPFTTGAAAVHTLSFTMLGFADSEPVLWTDDAAGGKLHQAASTVAFQQAAFDRLRAHALSPDASLTMIRQVRTEEYGRD
ncbi:Scr1 family TA system antitoxin-like transcriptional regulator [Streptomyces xiamenensis]|uniref:Scr1 family TA system antitoxin-like transcriptional regulator n=1 Tax=Streptomyces xiamenensis TaxID=408015 RepID=UPI0036A29E3D